MQETYFWREFPQIKALTEKIVPEWFGARATLSPLVRRLRLGRGALLHCHFLVGKKPGDAPIEILASDASPAALLKAGAAIYHEHSFRAFSLSLRHKYFSPVAGGWKLSQRSPNASSLNAPTFLIRPKSPLARVQVIFCRNVFIYFSPHSIRQAVATIATRMPTGGHLFVGAAESLLRMTADFELQEVAGALAYVRI